MGFRGMIDPQIIFLKGAIYNVFDTIYNTIQCKSWYIKAMLSGTYLEWTVQFGAFWWYFVKILP